MTREEAIKILDDERIVYWTEPKEGIEAIKQNKAIDMAIEALSEPKWIPCSERLPSDDNFVLVTFYDRLEQDSDIWIGWCELEDTWYVDGEICNKGRRYEVIAWMPLPEPYKVGEQSE